MRRALRGKFGQNQWQPPYPLPQLHKLRDFFEYDDAVVKLIVSRCTEVESGGRMVDAILTNTMLPRMSEEFLRRLVAGTPVTRVAIGVENADLAYRFDA